MKKNSMKIRFGVVIIILIVMAFLCQPTVVMSQVITDKKNYNYGEVIRVNFSSAPGNDSDWISIVPAGSPDTEAGDYYQYMPKGQSQGDLTFESITPGDYEVRAYYNYARKGYVVFSRQAFSVATNPTFEKLKLERMKRKIDPNNPLETNLLPDKGLVYILREPWTLSNIFNVEVKANGNLIAVMPSMYYLFSVPAGIVTFSTGDLIDSSVPDLRLNKVWSPQKAEATIRIEQGYVYYIKLKVVFMGAPLIPSLEHIEHKEGAELIDTYKLKQLK
jgi:hypothetical protein